MKLKTTLLLVLVAIGIILRLQNLHILPIDAHAMRQTDTESVAYNFAFRNHNILFPQNSLIRPLTNKQSYFFLEFPAYEYTIGIIYLIFGWHVEAARLFNLFLFVISFWSLYYFVKNYIDEIIALWSVFFFTFVPSSIFFFGHAIHPDIFAITTILGSLALYVKWKNSENILFFLLALFCLTLSVATRPFIAIILPAFLFLSWSLKAYKWEYPFIAIGPFVLYGFWRLWQLQFKEADNSWENWVFTGQAELFKKEVLIDRLILKNVTGEVVGKVTSLLAGLGFIALFLKRNKASVFLFLWLAGIPAYWYLVPSGNIIHQYYANVYLLPIIIMAACGTAYFLNLIEQRFKRIVFLFIGAIILLVLYNGIHTSQYFYLLRVPENQLRIAEDINKAIPFGARLVYLGNLNSIPFSLYHRKGWMLGAAPVDVDPKADFILGMKKYGAEYIVAGKDNTDLPEPELKKIEEKTDLVYKSSWTKIYKYR